MNGNDPLEQWLRELGETFADEKPLAAGVMEQIEGGKVSAPLSAARRHRWILTPALASWAFLVAALGFWLLKASGVAGGNGQVLAAVRAAPAQMSVSIFFLLMLLLGLGYLFVRIPLGLWLATRRRRSALVWVGIAGLLLVLLVGHVLWLSANVPAPAPIHETFTVTDSTGALTVTAISVEPKEDQSVIEVNVSNTSATKGFLGLAYYVNGGRLGPFFRPGASQGGAVKSIPPNWSGTVEFDLRTPFQLGYGAAVDIAIGTSTVSHEYDLVVTLPQDVEEIYAKRLVLVPKR